MAAEREGNNHKAEVNGADWSRVPNAVRLGSGSFGDVYKMLKKSTGEYAAGKFICVRGESDLLAKCKKEADLMMALRHERLLTCFGYYLCHADRYLVILTELMNGSVKQLLLVDGDDKRRTPLKETTAVRYLIEAAEGLRYLHRECTGGNTDTEDAEHQIVHGDVKSANLLLKNDSVKLADFGLSKIVRMQKKGASSALTANSGKLAGKFGTTFFMAPEVAKGEQSGRKADVWSLGCTAIEMLTGFAPHQRNISVREFEAMMVEGRALAYDVRELCPAASPELQMVLQEMLQWEEGDRLTSAEVLEYLWCLPSSEEKQTKNRDNGERTVTEAATTPTGAADREENVWKDETYTRFFPAGQPLECHQVNDKASLNTAVVRIDEEADVRPVMQQQASVGAALAPLPVTAPMVFRPPTDAWQSAICSQLGIDDSGRSPVPFGGVCAFDQRFVPVPGAGVTIDSDGNCFFHAISYAICGRPDADGLFRWAVCEFMRENAVDTFNQRLERPYRTVSEYLRHTQMDRIATSGAENHKWATDIEIVAACMRFECIIYVYKPRSGENEAHSAQEIPDGYKWQKFSTFDFVPPTPDSDRQEDELPTIVLDNSGEHFTLLCAMDASGATIGGGNLREEAEKHRCPDCQMCYSDPLLLAQHIRVQHGGEKPFKCPQCEKSFQWKKSVAEHVASAHNKRTFPCPKCGRLFAWARTLRRHERNVHYDISEVRRRCDECQLMLRSDYALQKHRCEVHGAEKPYACSQQGCSYQGFGSTDLTRHIRMIHSGERPFVCATCQAAFARKDHLIAHERTHSGEKPFECQFRCGYSTSESGRCRRHEQKYCSERPGRPEKKKKKKKKTTD